MKAYTKLTGIILTSVLGLSLAACSEENIKTSNKKEGYSPKSAITVVAPSGAGGGWDLTARSISKIVSETELVKKALTVENKPGGGGAVFMAEYATKQVDNNEMLFVNSPPLIINNLKKEGNSPYGTKDVTPIANLTKDFGAIAVGADSKYNDLQSLLDDWKKDPSKITLAGGSAPGSMDHLIGILPAYKSGIDLSKVKYLSYDGGGEAITALLGNNADVIATDASSVTEFLKAGKIKVLAVTATERLGGDLAAVPTLQESGIDAEFTIWRGLFGPKNMSDEAYTYWQDVMKRLVDTQEWQDELKQMGWQSDYKNGEEFATFLSEQEAAITDLLTALNMNQ